MAVKAQPLTMASPVTSGVDGSIWTSGGNLYDDGIGNLTAGSLAANQTTGTVQTMAGSDTITVAASTGTVRVTAAGAVTGCILAPGTRPGQLLTVIHEGAAANTITMATAATSNVAAGTTCVLSGLAAHLFVWDSVTTRWYQVGPATN